MSQQFHDRQDAVHFIDAWIALFNLIKQDPCQAAVELCCGIFPKVGLAIDSKNLATHVTYVDHSSSVLARCQDRVLEHSRNTSFSFLNQSVESVKFQSNMELITGNHILDDLLIEHYLQCRGKSGLNPFESKTQFLSLISEVLEFYSGYQSNVLKQFAHQVDQWLTENGRFILTEYRSWHEQQYNLFKWPESRLKLMEVLNQNFIDMGYQVMDVSDKLPLFTRAICWQKSC